jgi:hypothetical protein
MEEYSVLCEWKCIAIFANYCKTTYTSSNNHSKTGAFMCYLLAPFPSSGMSVGKKSPYMSGSSHFFIAYCISYFFSIFNAISHSGKPY